MQFIPAMSATHIDNKRLEDIINRMESYTTIDVNVGDGLRAYVSDKYDIDISCVPSYGRVPYVAEEKFDGFSYLNINGRFISKSLSQAKDTKGQLVDKTDWVPHLACDMQYISDRTPCDIHGELHIPGGTSDDVSSILGCTVEEALSRQEHGEPLHFTWLDIRSINGKSVVDEPYYIRRAILSALYDEYYGDAWSEGYIHLAPVLFSPIDNFNRIVSEGGEGLVFKRTDGLYTPGKKPINNWIKCKKRITLDVMIIGYNNDGSGKNKDLFKSIQIGMMIDGKQKHVGNVHSGVSDELRLDMHNNRESYINRVIEVEAMEMMEGDGTISLRHARLIRFRDDKATHECTTDGVEIHMI